MAEKRGIKVILISDVVGSTEQMDAHEDTTVELIERDLELFAHHVLACSGELIKNTGDGILASFPTTTQALEFIQNSLRDLHKLPGPTLQHRFGLHIGEIYLRGDDILGRGVNLAARLQTISPPNGVAFTQGTYANIDPHFRSQVVPLGERDLKGFPEKVRCYSLQESSFLAASDLDRRRPWYSRWASLRRRLNGSTRSQAITAASLLLLGLVFDLVPANPIAASLLDRRLRLQKAWRALTAQPGPQRQPLPVLLLESREPLFPRAQLTKVLLALPPERFPNVALDFVLDQQGPDPASTQQLIDVIRRQQRPSLHIGYFGSQTAARDAGRRSEPIEALQLPGVRPSDLAIGTVAGSGGIKPPPLQLLLPISQEHLASALARGGATAMPADAVIDWSLGWDRMLRVVSAPEQLGTNPQPLVLVGRIGASSQADPDLFRTPLAFYDVEPLWGGSAHEMPGVLLQAVLAQSLSLRHWLTPLSSFFCVALAAGAGILLAAALPSPRRRLQILLMVVPAVGMLSLQLAISWGLLIPLALPTLAMASTSLMRRE